MHGKVNRTTVAQRRSVRLWVGATLLTTIATGLLLPSPSWVVPGALAALVALLTGAKTLRLALPPPRGLLLTERLLFAIVVWAGLLRLTAGGFTLLGSAGPSSTAFLLMLLLGGPLSVALVGTWAVSLRRLSELEQAHRRSARRGRPAKAALWRRAPPVAVAAALTLLGALAAVVCRIGAAGALPSAIVLLGFSVGGLAFALAIQKSSWSTVSAGVLLFGQLAASVLSTPVLFAVPLVVSSWDPDLDIENNDAVSFLLQLSGGFCLLGLRFWLAHPLAYLEKAPRLVPRQGSDRILS